MLRHVLLAGTVAIAAPAFTQTAPTMRVPPAQSAPTGTNIEAQTSPKVPSQATPADPVTIMPSSTAAAQAPRAAQTVPMTRGDVAAPPSAAPARPASAPTSSDVAAVVDREFPTYDRNKDGKLDRAEFAEWMVALKTVNDPATRADSAETRSWVAGAFAQADADQDRALSKAELNGFLTQGRS